MTNIIESEEFELWKQNQANKSSSIFISGVYSRCLDNIPSVEKGHKQGYITGFNKALELGAAIERHKIYSELATDNWFYEKMRDEAAAEVARIMGE